MSDESPEVNKDAAAVPEETFVVSQKEIAGKVFYDLVPNPLRPKSTVSLRWLSDTEKRRIHDKHKVSFGDKPMNVKFGNSFEEIQSRSFVNMKGWSKAPGQPIESTPENFIDFVASHQFVRDGEDTTVWTSCEKQMKEQLFGAEKNS